MGKQAVSADQRRKACDEIQRLPPYAGDIDYDGQTQSGAAIDSSSDQKIRDI